MNGETAWIGYFLLGIIYIAILYALIQPSSKANAAISGLSHALASLVSTAVGGSTTAQSQGTQLV